MIREYIIPVKCPRLNNFMNTHNHHPKTVEAIVKFDDDNTDGIVNPKGIICSHYLKGFCRDDDKPKEQISCLYSGGFKPFPRTSQ